ncbi:MAG: type II toxin-antitoxin system RelE/ParE family toxin [Burkholderiales bacterium]
MRYSIYKMPETEIFFFQDADGHSPVVEWLEELRRTDPKALGNCLVVVERLRQDGHELRRPTADLLRDGIYELRAKKQHVQYRLLYFFHGRNVAILAHGLIKEDVVPPADIERALRRKKLFEADPEAHKCRSERYGRL